MATNDVSGKDVVKQITHGHIKERSERLYADLIEAQCVAGRGRDLINQHKERACVTLDTIL